MSQQVPETVAEPAPSRRGPLRRNAVSVALGLTVTVAVELAALAVASRTMSPARSAEAAVLLAGLWVFIAAPVWSASAASPVGGFLRGGAVIDASLAVLVVLAAGGWPLGWRGAVEIYLVLAAVGLACCTLVWTGRTLRARAVLAAVAVLLVLAVSAGPFWANGAVMATPAPWSGRIAWAVVAANPVLACAQGLAPARFVWQESPVLYEFTVLGRDAPMPTPPWYATVAIYAVLAAAIGGVAATRRRRKSRAL